MIISLTILSLVVLTVYLSFSLGVDVWQRMDESRSPERRRAMALRLVQEDFRTLRPYTWQGEKGEFSFFSGGPRCVFYVTTNALGAKTGQEKKLFFTCLFLRSTSEHGLSLYMYKSGLPAAKLLEAVRKFRSGDQREREEYVPPEEIVEASVFVLGDLQEAGFSFQGQAYPIFSGVKAELERDQEDEEQEALLARTEWMQGTLPEQIGLKMQVAQETLIVRNVLTGRLLQKPR